MKETGENENFPFRTNIPLAPGEVVKSIGDFERQLQAQGDFPKKVEIKRKDGVVIRSTLTQVFTDGGSQGDGTFYFSDKVREIPHATKVNYLFGQEIESITFLE